jgi:hypothetical protein
LDQVQGEKRALRATHRSRKIFQKGPAKSIFHFVFHPIPDPDQGKIGSTLIIVHAKCLPLRAGLCVELECQDLKTPNARDLPPLTNLARPEVT